MFDGWRRWEHAAAQQRALESRRQQLLAEMSEIDAQLTALNVQEGVA